MSCHKVFQILYKKKLPFKNFSSEHTIKLFAWLNSRVDRISFEEDLVFGILLSETLATV